MPDNNAEDITTLLVRYIDDELETNQQTEVERLLRENERVNDEYNLLLAAKSAIKDYGLKQKVGALHKEMMQELKPATQPVKIRRMSFAQKLMRVAAVLIIAVAGFGVIQYSTTNSNKLYSDNYIPYYQNVTRSNGKQNRIDQLYNTGKYALVINLVDEKPVKEQQDYFLEGQSYLQLNKPQNAIQYFEKLKQLNTAQTKNLYADANDYYEMLAYIKAENITAAKALRAQILSNPKHSYYQKTKDISGFKLWLLGLKN